MARVGHGGANRAYLGCGSVVLLPGFVMRKPPCGAFRPVFPQSGASTVSLEEGGPPVTRPTDTRLQDPLVLDEIELYGELVIAASSSDHPLSRDEIDHVLGVDEARD